MSDAGRKDFSTKVQEHIKPEAQKPATEKLGETISNAADTIASAVQPEEDKGVLQKAADDTKLTKDNAKVSGESWIDTAKKEGGVLLNTAKNAVNQAAEYVAGSTASAKTTTPEVTDPTKAAPK